MATIAFFELEGWEKDYLKKKLGRKHRLLFIEGALTEKNIPQAALADVLSVFIYSRIGEKELAQLPNVKLVATRSTGYDHVDLKACKSHGIAVCNVPSYGSETVAEYAVALMLSLVKKIPQSMERTRRGEFTTTGLRAFDLEKKTLGIVGLGKIGQHVAKMARSFGMKVIATSPHLTPEEAKKFKCRLVTLDELLAKSDVISLHAPQTQETRHMINSESIAKMKKGAILINTARGGLVDAKALLSALDSGQIGGAGLDVLEEECNVKEERQVISPEFAGECDLKAVLANHILLNKPNVIITPHNAFNSSEALQRILDTTRGNIEAFVEGKAENTVGN
ncbi:MAG: hydroxyacid dehydrogenase [Candidatus Micrarchaeia archaeon]